jgi:UTP--glucose-1-phosphate uridylyltransferase
VFAYEYDVGEKLGFIKTTIEFALKDKETSRLLLPELEKLLKEIKVKG